MKKNLYFLYLLVFSLLFNYNIYASTLKINIEHEPSTIDPQYIEETSGKILNNLVNEGLVKKDKNGKILPGLAKEWSVSKNGLTWTFKLKDNIKWSNGEPITANDFKNAWLRALDPTNPSGFSYMLYYIKNAKNYSNGDSSIQYVGIKAIDNKTLQVTLEKPTPYFLELLSNSIYMPSNEKYLNKFGEEYGTELDKILYSGKYIIKSWEHDQEIVLEKNPHYYDQKEIKVDEVILKIYYDNKKALEDYKNKKLDITKVNVENLSKFNDSYELTTRNNGSFWYLLINHNDKVLSNLKIKKALLMGINREDLAKEVFYKNGEKAKTITPREVGIKGLTKENFADEVLTSIPEYNQVEAKKLLEEGLKELGLNKFPSYTLTINDAPNNKKIAEYIKRSLSKNLGINIKINTMTFRDRVEKMKNKKFDLVLAGWSGDFEDPITYLDLFETNGGNNHGSFSNLKYDQLIKTVNSTGNQKTRYTSMVEMEKIISEELPIIPLLHKKNSYLINSKVKGLGFAPLNEEYNFTDVVIEK